MISPYTLTLDGSTKGYIYDLIMAQMPTADLTSDIKECSIISSINNSDVISFTTTMNDAGDSNQYGKLNAGESISGDVDIYNTYIVTDSVNPLELLVLVGWE